jgi:hypothetical protein
LLFIPCLFVHIKNDGNFLLLYHIDDAMAYLWRPDNRPILMPGFHRMNLKYCTFHSWSTHFLKYTSIHTLLCNESAWVRTFSTNNAYQWVEMLKLYDEQCDECLQDNFFYIVNINSQVYLFLITPFGILIFSSPVRCIRYNIMG